MMIALKAKQKRHYDKIARNYTKNIDQRSYDYYFCFTKMALLNTLKNHFKNLKSCKGLDNGCGNGDLARAVREHCKSMTGADISKGMIALSKNKKSDVKFTCAPSDKLPFKDSAFDFVISTHLFHHLITDRLVDATVNEMKRVVKKGGIIVILDTNKLNPLSGFMQCLMVKRGVDTGDEKLLSPTKLIKILKKHNMKYIRYEVSCTIPHFLPLLKQLNPVLEKSIVGKVMAKDYVICGCK